MDCAGCFEVPIVLQAKSQHRSPHRFVIQGWNGNTWEDSRHGGMTSDAAQKWAVENRTRFSMPNTRLRIVPSQRPKPENHRKPPSHLTERPTARNIHPVNIRNATPGTLVQLNAGHAKLPQGLRGVVYELDTSRLHPVAAILFEDGKGL